ncbi:MAG: peptidoglycan bridge formation glycyltransferase FemA/FemB family protein, partial [Blastococcus sp.]|nr:peptidoglycan bridge formation glycyltransferase FemA/FemB family protein [Blastococcus sp.]
MSVAVTETPGAAQLAAWDALVSAHPGADVTQLSGWARVRRLAGYSPLYVLAYDGDRIVGGAQLLVRRVPLLGSIGYAPYGPLVFGHGDHADDVHSLLADTLRDLVADRLRILFVQPPTGGEHSSRALMARGFRLSDAGVSPSVSLRVDLDVDAHELRQNLPKRMRKRINQWERRGVTVRVGDEGDLPTVAELNKATGEHHGFNGFSLDYLTAMYRELTPGGHLVLLVGEFEGRPVAVQLCTGAGGVLTARTTGFDRSSAGAHLRVPAATVWAAMQWGRENGYRSFDFGGIEERSAAVLEAGGPVEDMASFDQVKTDFGGRLVRYPEAVELIASPLVRWAYDLARRST